jgi:hypothetical protein
MLSVAYSGGCHNTPAPTDHVTGAGSAAEQCATSEPGECNRWRVYPQLGWPTFGDFTIPPPPRGERLDRQRAQTDEGGHPYAHVKRDQRCSERRQRSAIETYAKRGNIVWDAGTMRLISGSQLVDQHLCLFQVARVKPFREPAVDQSETL